MNKLNFILKKDNNIIINENDIKCINQNNKLIFKLNGIKYIFNNNILTKETDNELIELDFNKEQCNIFLKEYNNNLLVNMSLLNIENKENFIEIKYKIETEENCINIIRMEYIKK